MDIISDYYESLSKVKILSKEEEKREFLKYKKGNRRSGELLIESCLRLCFSIAKGYWKDNNTETLKDLISAGNEGLMKALTKFDITRNVKFSTYSAYWILMYIRKYVVEDSRIVKPPIAVRRKMRLKDGTTKATDIVYREAADYNCVCPSATPEETYMESDLKANQAFLLESLCRFLTIRERSILESSFGNSKTPPASLASIGETMCLSSERVRQIKESAVSKLSYWQKYFR